MMQSPFTRSIAVTSFAIATLAANLSWGQQSATAQSDSGCYMVTDSGKVVKLDKLCGGSAPPATNASMVKAKIKRRLGGIPVIDVTFNGRQTYEMIVDTGASGTLITQSMASALNVPIVGVERSTVADGSLVLFPIGQLQSMSVNGAEVRNVQVAIAERMPIGLLGHDFFNNYDVKIKQDVVEFYRR